MENILFGTSGIPSSTKKPSTTEGIIESRRLGLGAMEIAFTQGIYIKNPEEAESVKKAAEDSRIRLSVHAPYFINLNSDDEYKVNSSIKRIMDSARVAAMCGAKSLVFHAAFYMKKDKEDVYKKVKKAVESMADALKEEGIDICLRPETMGKSAQFGSLNEVVKLSKEVEGVMPCIDISHLHARNIGKKNSLEDFREILDYVKKELGEKALHDMHFHCSGIHYTEHGERYHLPLAKSDFNYKDFLRALKEFDVRGVVISESPLQEKDALLMKEFYKNIV